jgi:STE24 endopeptidase
MVPPRLRNGLLGLLILSGSLLGAVPAESMAPQLPSVLVVPPAARASATFDAEKATQAYLAQIPASAKARSDAYFEGGYWLILWDFLYGSAVALLLLMTGWSARMRTLAEGFSRQKLVQAFAYWTQFLLVTTFLGFPLQVWEGFFRERRYGLTTQTFGPWLGDQAKGLLVGLILGGLLTALLFAIVRRLKTSWWLWATVAATAVMILTVLIAPVYLEPFFNKITPLDNPRITAPILSLARANNIPARDVYTMDASKQTTRMSAHVSGLGATTRITLNDNLVRRGSPEEIQSVMGHEMGHYVLNHVAKDMLFMFVVIAGFFGFLQWSLGWCLARWGSAWGIRDLGDLAVLPLAVLLISTLGFVLTPIMNTHTRTAEAEADQFGLNAARQPDGFAQAAIHLGEYRKMKPGPVEEYFFFDHPSGYRRIKAAMVWKAENLTDCKEPRS